MDGGYSQGNTPPAHMMGYFQGIPGYNVAQGTMPNTSQSNPPHSHVPPVIPPSQGPSTSNVRPANAISIWAGDLDAYMDENFLRQAVTASGWGPDITRIKVVRDHYSGMHAGYGFLDAASPEAAQRVIATGSGMPIPGTNRCWRLNMGRNTAHHHLGTGSGGNTSSGSSGGTMSGSVVQGNVGGGALGVVSTESNVYVGNLESSVTDYQLMSAFRTRYGSVRHAKVVCNEYGQSRGFGFVRFSNAADAERAVSEMQGYVFNSKPIRLSPAAGRTRGAGGNSGVSGISGRGNLMGGPPGGGYGGHHQHATGMPIMHGMGLGLGLSGSGGPTNKRPRQLMSPDDPNNTTIFIGGTASNITEELLWREFSTFGELEAVRVPVNKTGFAFVRFKSRGCATRAKDEVSGTHFASLNPVKPVRVEWASEQIPVARGSGSFGVGGGVGSCEGVDGGNGGSVGRGNRVNTVSGSGFDGGFSGGQNSAGEYGDGNGQEDGSESAGAGQNGAGYSGSKEVDCEADVTDSGKEAVKSNDCPERTEGGSGETEPPSKRAAVERPEYAVKGDGESDTGGHGNRNGISGEGDGHGNGSDTKGDRAGDAETEASPAMQFRWLNASSSSAGANGQ